MHNKEETLLEIVRPISVRQHVQWEDEFQSSLQISGITVVATYYDIKACFGHWLLCERLRLSCVPDCVCACCVSLIVCASMHTCV